MRRQTKYKRVTCNKRNLCNSSRKEGLWREPTKITLRGEQQREARGEGKEEHNNLRAYRDGIWLLAGGSDEGVRKTFGIQAAIPFSQLFHLPSSLFLFLPLFQEINTCQVDTDHHSWSPLATVLLLQKARALEQKIQCSTSYFFSNV